MASISLLMRASRRVGGSLIYPFVAGLSDAKVLQQGRIGIGYGPISLQRVKCEDDSFAAAYGEKVTFSTIATATYKSYAEDALSYNKALMSLIGQRRPFLLRDVYEDMLLDGVQPTQDSFYLLLKGCTKGGRLQDAMFFFEEMKSMGIIPDVMTYNLIIAVCGKCNHFDHAFQVWQKMETDGVNATVETFLSLLIACAVSGCTDEAYNVLKRMTTRGISSNDFGYASLIIAYMNKKPVMQEASEKIFDLLQQWKSGAASDFKSQVVVREAESFSEMEDEIWGLILGDLQMRRGVVNRRLLVYYAAFCAFAHFKNIEAVKKLCEICEKDGHKPDAFCLLQTIRCNLGCGDFNSALSEFDKYNKSGREASLDLYVEIIRGALLKCSDVGMAATRRLLREMDEKRFFLNTKIGSELLGRASKETGGDFSTADLVWDMMQKWRTRPLPAAVIPYYNCLQARGYATTDPRMLAARKYINENNHKFSWSSRKTAAVQIGHVDDEPDPDDENAEAFEHVLN